VWIAAVVLSAWQLKLVIADDRRELTPSRKNNDVWFSGGYRRCGPGRRGPDVIVV
jgi:hypothetical protein